VIADDRLVGTWERGCFVLAKILRERAGNWESQFEFFGKKMV